MLKKIKSLFVVESGQTSPKVAVPEKEQEPVSPGEPTGAFEQNPPGVSKASLDQFLKVLANAMDSGNMEGYDYLEFRQAIRSLSQIESDEQKRFVTAYTLAKTMGAEKMALKKSAGRYLDILKEEESKFNASLQHQIDSKLNTRTTQIQQLEQKSKEKLAQIEKLKEEIKSIEQKLKDVRLEMEESSRKVESVRMSFHSAYELIVNEIRTDIEKIDNYLNQ